MEKFMELYNEEYDLQCNNEYVVGTREAIEYFDTSLTTTEKEILKEFILYRGDFISSDREAVAFMFALDRYMNM